MFNLACPWMGEEGVVADGPDHALVVVGVLRYGAQYDGDGNLTVPPTVAEGWHVNLRLREGTPLPTALAPYVMPPPAFPKRVFAD